MKRTTKKILAYALSAAMAWSLAPIPVTTVSAASLKLKNTGAKQIMPLGSVFTVKTNKKADKVTFASNNEKVASVDSTGTITAVKKGTAKITVRFGSTKKTVTVKVQKPVGYTISQTSGTYEAPVSVTLNAKKGYRVYYTTGAKFTTKTVIKSSQKKTISVKKSGVIKVYASKKALKKSALNKSKVSSRSRGDYRYVIREAAAPATGGAVSAAPVASGTPAPAASAAASAPVATLPAPTASDAASTPAVTLPAPTADVSAQPGTSELPEVSGNPAITDEPQDTGTPQESEKPQESVIPQESDAPETPAPEPTSAYRGDDSMVGYVSPAPVTTDDTDEDDEIPEDEAEYTSIVIPAKASGTKVVKDNYVISKKNKITITASGTYVLSAEDPDVAADALIEADYASADDTGVLHLILDGVRLTSSNNSAPTSDTGLITIKKSVARCVITVADGSENLLYDEGETGIDKDDKVSTTYTAGIVCKKTPLTINGTGELGMISLHGNGIKATGSLKILDADITVGGQNTSNGHNGISAKTGLYMRDVTLKVSAMGDAVKTTLENEEVYGDGTQGSTVEELTDAGDIYLEGGEYDIYSEKGDALKAYRVLYVAADSLKADSDGDRETDGSCKAIKAGTSIEISEDAGEIYAVSDTDDGLHCGNTIRMWDEEKAQTVEKTVGTVKIDGGDLIDIRSGDDGIHSDVALVINNGKIGISAYEGMESGDITINDGGIEITAEGDGINAAGGAGDAEDGQDSFGTKDPEQYSSPLYQVIINGGAVMIKAKEDGIDSNGNIFIRGGLVGIEGPGDEKNGSFDYGHDGGAFEISGGIVAASGPAGDQMVLPTGGSTQYVMNFVFDSVLPAGTKVLIKNESGTKIGNMSSSKPIQSILISMPAFEEGQTYTFWAGEEGKEEQVGSITINDLISVRQ